MISNEHMYMYLLLIIYVLLMLNTYVHYLSYILCHSLPATELNTGVLLCRSLLATKLHTVNNQQSEILK